MNKFKLDQEAWIVRAAVAQDELISFQKVKIIEIYTYENKEGTFVRYEVMGIDQWTIDANKVFSSKNEAIDYVVNRLLELKI